MMKNPPFFPESRIMYPITHRKVKIITKTGKATFSFNPGFIEATAAIIYTAVAIFATIQNRIHPNAPADNFFLLTGRGVFLVMSFDIFDVGSPHFWQNVAVSGICVPHLLQNI